MAKNKNKKPAQPIQPKQPQANPPVEPEEAVLIDEKSDEEFEELIDSGVVQEVDEADIIEPDSSPTKPKGETNGEPIKILKTTVVNGTVVGKGEILEGVSRETRKRLIQLKKAEKVT